LNRQLSLSFVIVYQSDNSETAILNKLKKLYIQGDKVIWSPNDE